MALCDIGTVFLKLTEIKSNSDCTAGCAGGTGECGDIAQWYPGRADFCSAECGVVFEPFCAPDSSPSDPAAAADASSSAQGITARSNT